VAADGTHVYWADRADQSIGRENLDGTGVGRRFITGVTATALAVDAAHIYWDARDGSIGRANLDGTGVNPTFIPQVQATFGVAVDRAHVYWSTAGSIGRANLDGTGAQNFFAGDGGLFDQPCGVAVDAGHVYWANALGTIGRIDLNGLNANPNFVRAAPAGDDTCGVAVDAAHLYWAHFTIDSPPDPADDGIGRANLDGTGVNPAFITTPIPFGVALDAAAQATPPSRVSIGDVRMTEGNSGQTAFQFTVSLDQPQAASVTVGYSTADGTASAPSDYVAAAGAVTFAPGETAKTVTVAVNGDTTVEPDETFNFNLSNPIGNATIADGQGVGTIVNDDQAATPPAVTSVSPRSGPVGGGTAITITGSGFAPGDRVVIGQGNGAGAGAIAATRVSVLSSTQVTASTGGGARAGTWNLFVIAPNGTTSQVVGGDQFTYTVPSPVVSTVAPNAGPIAGGTAITVTGSGFAPGDTVVIGQGNGAGAGAIGATRVSVLSPTQVTASTGGGARAGTWNLFVIAPNGTTSQAVSGDQFTYTAG
jgi:hypothetical protein